MYEILLKEIEGLPPEMMEYAIQFIRFLKIEIPNKTNDAEVEKSARLSKRKKGILAGGLQYMADDFDETPDCFKEYM